MSLVGTRPPTVDEWDKYELHHRARLATKPGLTGMWQVSGRSNITDWAWLWVKHSGINFDVIHHVTMNDYRIPSELYKAKGAKVIWGPMGGAQVRTHDSSQKAGETIEKSTGLYFVTFVHNVEISDCFPRGKRSLPFPFFFVFWKPGLFDTKKQTMFF